jgi:hypothetical protein
MATLIFDRRYSRVYTVLHIIVHVSLRLLLLQLYKMRLHSCTLNCCQDDSEKRSVPHSEAHDATATARYPLQCPTEYRTYQMSMLNERPHAPTIMSSLFEKTQFAILVGLGLQCYTSCLHQATCRFVAVVADTSATTATNRDVVVLVRVF